MKLAVLISANDGFPEGQIASACSIANVLDAPLTGIAASEEHLRYYSGGGSLYNVVADTAVRVVDEKLDDLAKRFQKVCDDAQVAHDWVGIHGFIDHHWLDISPYFDLAITAAPLSAPELATRGISGTMQISDDADIGAFDQRCVIAWDGSPEAGRAVRAALPLLPRFKTVDVILVDPKSRTMSHDIGAYLGSHEISANILREPSSGSSIATLILEEAEKADLLVMGAYGSSKTLEKMFGGVTETMRRDCGKPVIFAN